MAKNIYTHSIDLERRTIKNAPREIFAQSLKELPYRGYEVEKIADGTSIVITKPGGKSVYGRPKKEDFLVYIHNPQENTLWQITHKQIFEDIQNKAEEDATQTKQLLSLLERVQNGEDPDDFIDEINALKFNQGELPETFLKVYKWIWGQEDVNYPNGDGRKMSWRSLKEFGNKL